MLQKSGNVISPTSIIHDERPNGQLSGMITVGRGVGEKYDHRVDVSTPRNHNPKVIYQTFSLLHSSSNILVRIL
jgi:hypothetical protein